jgi:hypothetical protein
MIRSDNKLKELSAILNKNNSLIITESIEVLRLEKPFEGAIGLLTAYFDKTEEHSVRTSIAGFLNDLKDPTVCPEVIAEITRPWKPGTISMLVSSCWQSGLNYSEYALDLAKTFIKSDYVTAIECLTVIEESVEDLSRERKDEVIKLIENSASVIPANILSLKDELLLILER